MILKRNIFKRKRTTLCRLKIKEETINAFIIIPTHDIEKQFIHSKYEYCFSIMELIHREENFITPSNPLDVSNIFTCCTFSHVKIIPYVFYKTYNSSYRIIF